MSKGNIYLGYGRGAIGDLVLTRMKGQQIGRARNRHPSNPRTALQMRQRAGFISPLKFYTRGVQNLFQFAFTDKRLKESDYNAFMRINVGGGFPLTPSEFQMQGFPALGSWVLSRGSLTGIPIEMVGTHSNNLGMHMTHELDTQTVGNFSGWLIANNLADEGDIITFVIIRADGAVVTSNSISVDEGAQVRWYINQLKVESNSQKPMSVAMPHVERYQVGNQYYFGISAESSAVNETTVGMAVIRSKITSKGLRVSTSRMLCGGYVDDFIAFRNTPAEIQRVLVEWGASSGAILKGGILG